MKSIQKLGLVLLFAACSAGCEDRIVPLSCQNGAFKCDGGILYQCEDANQSNFWRIYAMCSTNECQNEQACGFVDACQDPNTGESWVRLPDGSCVYQCVYGYDYDVQLGRFVCKRAESCVTKEWELDGSCQCRQSCSDNCDATGECITNCVNGYTLEGRCFCPESCNYMCEPNGSCKKCPSCVRGCDENDKCLCDLSICSASCDQYGNCCPERCQNGCQMVNGLAQCICPEMCKVEIELEDGSKTRCDENGACLQDSFCRSNHDRDGSCMCPSFCREGCLSNGACTKENACSIDAECKEVAACMHQDCFCDYNPDGEKEYGVCRLVDANRNHLHDKLELQPLGEHFGQACRMDADCNDSGHDNGFCDSALGYRCAVRCASDGDCVDNERDGFHYVCRADGRCAPDVFVTRWHVSDSKLLHLPHGSECDFHVDWGDGTGSDISDCDELNNPHKYNHSGDYTVTISKGSGPKVIYRGFSLCTVVDSNEGIYQFSDNYPLLRIDAFGPVVLGPAAFCGQNPVVLFSDIDIPDASQLTSMRSMFEGSSLNLNIEHWDVSNVTDMQSVFKDNPAFNQPLDRWNTSNVTTMQSMFHGAAAFNQPIGSWDVSNVTDMSNMFHGAAAFNQPLNDWNTSKVTTMQGMFQGATAFNGAIGGWDVSNVTDMSNMFNGAAAINQPLNDWKTSKVTTMQGMFQGAAAFNGAIGSWDVSNVTDMSSMFNNAKAFNQSLKDWKCTNLGQVDNMFAGSGMNECNFCVFRSKLPVQMQSNINLHYCYGSYSNCQ